MFLRDSLCHKKTLFICLLLCCFCSFLFSLFSSQSASAYTYWQDYPTFTMVRTFQNAQCDLSLKDVDNNTSPLPYKILWANSSGACVPTLFGFTITAIPISSNLYSTYNTVYVDFTLEVPQNRRGNWFETNNFSIRIGTSQNFENGTCAIAQNTYNRAQFHCAVAASADFRPDYAYVEVGYPDITASQLYTGYVGLAREDDISLVYLGWGFDARQSAEAGYLEQITLQNERIISSLDSIENGEQERWETEREEQDAKEQELEDQADDLSLSTPVTPNPFSQLFVNNYSTGMATCYSLPTISGWFGRTGNDIITFCSPYPTTIYNVLRGTSSIFVIALLLRLYYKKLKGGVDG